MNIGTLFDEDFFDFLQTQDVRLSPTWKGGDVAGNALSEGLSDFLDGFSGSTDFTSNVANYFSGISEPLTAANPGQPPTRVGRMTLEAARTW